MVLGTMVAIVRQHDSPSCGGVKGKTTRNCGGIAGDTGLFWPIYATLRPSERPSPRVAREGRISKTVRQQEVGSARNRSKPASGAAFRNLLTRPICYK